MLYQVNEIFSGLEGEGHNPGTPTIRVRLQGCNVPCKLRKVCDQPEALASGAGLTMSLTEIVAQVQRLDEAAARPFPWVSVSGGEPLEQPIEPLLWKLQEIGKRVRVETSGQPRRLEGPVDYIRVSPKEPVPKRTKQDWGLELSVVWTGKENLESWEHWGNFAMRSLQPLWQPDGDSNVEEVIGLCLRYPCWQLSVQVHKWLNLP